MKKLLVYQGDESGCFLHRLLLPHEKMKELTSDFDITISNLEDFKTFEEKIAYIGTFDALVFHRLLPTGWMFNIKNQYPNIKTIMDMDDYWNLSQQHTAYSTYKIFNLSDSIKYHMAKSDLITCTTDILREKILPLNKNVVILPNSLVPEGQFEPHDNPSRRIRFGLIGGSSHKRDIEMLDGLIKMMPQDMLDKVQFVLCGFDKGLIRTVDNNNQVTGVQQMDWNEVCWTRFERILTDNYRTVSPEHEKFLKEFHVQYQYNDDEPYKRIWTKSIYRYMNSYDDIDILLAPLEDTEFNHCKSELKLIEASVKNKCAIVSDVYPYKICGINMFDYGGNLNEDGNCIMVNNRKGAKGWFKAIKKVVESPDLRDLMRKNLAKLTAPEGEYNLETVTKRRIEEYKKLWENL